ncbi:MAG TPA: IPT/TIG domain-containing protein [Terriglobales bacterium]|nr:IPT/TIG domain-containing protein [Terriglobales bacterium]
MKKGYVSTLLIIVVAAAALIGCGTRGGSGSGSATNTPNPPQNDFAGAWEFVMTSSVYPSGGGGNITLVEAIVTQNGSALSASGQQVQVIGVIAGGTYPAKFVIDGNCAQPTPGTNTFAGAVSSENGKPTAVSLAFDEGGVQYTASAIVSDDGTIDGTYVGGSGPCAGDAGVLVGYGVPSLTGTYVGVLSLSGSDAVTANLVEAKNYSLAVNGIPNVSLNGTVVADAAFASGTIDGSSVSLFTFFDPAGTFTGLTGPTLSVFDAKTFAFYGALGGTTVQTQTVPSIIGISPGSGVVGTPVTITGANFGSTQGTSTVTFNGVTGAPTSWSATSIVVPVPSGATTGNVVVSVNGVASNGVPFTVQPTPSITSLSPTSGVVGTLVTVSGTNFGATQGTSMVTFNGTVGAPVSWSATSIQVPVPSGATTGNVVVTVGGVPSSGVAFTVP